MANEMDSLCVYFSNAEEKKLACCVVYSSQDVLWAGRLNMLKRLEVDFSKNLWTIVFRF